MQVAGDVVEGMPVGDRRENADREEQGRPEGGENTQDAAPHVAPDRRTPHTRARDQEAREKEETRDGRIGSAVLIRYCGVTRQYQEPSVMPFRVTAFE